MEYFNYHKHSYKSNISTTDSVCSVEDYAKRTVELGHKYLSCCEHGNAYSFLTDYLVAKKNNLKFVFCVEAYFVKDRLEKDDKNYHLILIAKNNEGRKAINRILAQSNEDGYYYKNRIDVALLKTLPKDSVYCTTACSGGIFKDDNYELFNDLLEIFDTNLFLEYSPHNYPREIEHNKKILDLAEKHKLKVVVGVDSHYIYPEQAIERDVLLKSNGIFYDEDSYILDFPDYNTLFDRILKQGLLSSDKTSEYIRNTLILGEVEEYNLEIKMRIPTIFKDKTREERQSMFKKLIFDKFEEFRINRSLVEEEVAMYTDEIMLEYDIIAQTDTQDYFLNNYHIIKRGVEKGGTITPTGRGSGASFFINFLLGFTTIDRTKVKTPILPHRFMTIERVLQNLSLPDIDFNLYDRHFFEEAQKELFGEFSSYYMTSYDKLAVKSAFRMYCRAEDVPVEIADEISKLISNYEKDVHHADEEHKDDIDINDYILNDEYRDIFANSKKYRGVLKTIKPHASGTLISDENLREEFGLLRTPSKQLVVNIQDKHAEMFGYVKNDLLHVNVVGLNKALYERIGMKMPSFEELLELVRTDKKVWNLYNNGITVGLNQCETTSTIAKAKECTIDTPEDLFNFIAIIRPSCKNIYHAYKNREELSYNVKELDELLRGSYLTGSFLIFQEQLLQLFQWLGFGASESAIIMKAISKKADGVISSVKEKMLSKLTELVPDNYQEVFNKLWEVVGEASKYAFNAPHSVSVGGDSLYSAYVKANNTGEYYEVLLNITDNFKKIADAKNEMMKHFGINILPYRYGQDNRTYRYNKELNAMTPSLTSMKSFGKDSVDILKQFEGDTEKDFINIYYKLKEAGIGNADILKLARINYFADIAPIENCIWIIENIEKLKLIFKKDRICDFHKENNIGIGMLAFEELLEANAVSVTAKQMKFEAGTLIRVISRVIVPKKIVFINRIYWEMFYLGNIGGTGNEVDENINVGVVTHYDNIKNFIKFKNCREVLEDRYKVSSSINIKKKDIIIIANVDTFTTKSGYKVKTIRTFYNLTDICSDKKKTGEGDGKI